MEKRPIKPLAGHPTILVVDDDHATAEVASLLLGAQGYRCEIARTPDEARRLLLSSPVALCLCDFYYGRQSGFELAREIAELAPDVALVMMSSSDDVTVVEKALELGAYGYLLKPLRETELAIAVKNALHVAGSSASRGNCAAGSRMPWRRRARRRSTGSPGPSSSAIRRPAATSSG